MLGPARGPVWQRQPQKQGIIPHGRQGLDTAGTWRYRQSGGWGYGHGAFCVVAGRTRVLGAFKWMPNRGNEAKRLWLETGKLKGVITTVLMDRKAEDKDLFFELRRQRGLLLLTTARKGADKRPARHRRGKVLKQRKNKRLYQQRRYTVEPRQGLLKDIFDLERCWRRGKENNRWVFAALGVAMQMPQYRAWRDGRSPWAIKSEVLGR